MPGPSIERTPGPLEGTGRMGVEESESHGGGDPETDADFGGQPTQVTEHDGAVQGETNEVADEEQLPSQRTPRAETATVGAQRQNQRNDDQSGNAMAAEGDPESQGRDDGDGDQKERDHLTLGP